MEAALLGCVALELTESLLMSTHEGTFSDRGQRHARFDFSLPYVIKCCTVEAAVLNAEGALTGGGGESCTFTVGIDNVRLSGYLVLKGFIYLPIGMEEI